MTESPRISAISSGLSEPGGPIASSTLRTSGALFLWLALQLAILAIAAFHFPLWAHAPDAEDLLALQFLLVVQLGASALLFPLLMGTWRQTVFITASSWPMIVLAGMLSSESLKAIGLAVIFITLWLLALALIIWAIGKRNSNSESAFHPPLRTTKREMIAVALVSVWTIGGSLLLFSRVEYDPSASALGPWSKALFGPISSVFSAVFDSAASSWAPLVIVWIAAIGLAGFRNIMIANAKTLQSDRPLAPH